MPPQLVDDNGNPVSSNTLVDDDGNPIIKEEAKGPIDPKRVKTGVTTKDNSLLEGVENFFSRAIFGPDSENTPGVFGPNSPLNQQLRAAGRPEQRGFDSTLRIPGVQWGFNKLADLLDPPDKTVSGPAAFGAGVLEGVGNLLSDAEIFAPAGTNVKIPEMAGTGGSRALREGAEAAALRNQKQIPAIGQTARKFVGGEKGIAAESPLPPEMMDPALAAEVERANLKRQSIPLDYASTETQPGSRFTGEAAPPNIPVVEGEELPQRLLGTGVQPTKGQLQLPPAIERQFVTSPTGQIIEVTRPASEIPEDAFGLVNTPLKPRGNRNPITGKFEKSKDIEVPPKEDVPLIRGEEVPSGEINPNRFDAIPRAGWKGTNPVTASIPPRPPIDPTQQTGIFEQPSAPRGPFVPRRESLFTERQAAQAAEGSGTPNPRDITPVVKPGANPAGWPLRGPAARTSAFEGTTVPVAPTQPVGGIVQGINPDAYHIIGRTKPVRDTPGLLKRIWDMPKELTATDLPWTTSMAFRQGSFWVGTKPWRQAWAKSIQTYGSKATADAIEAARMQRELFAPRYEPVLNANGMPRYIGGKQVLKELPSYAEHWGLRRNLVDERAESLAEAIPGYGEHLKGSNRSARAFTNHIGDTVLEQMVDYATKIGQDPRKNDKIGKAIADFINVSLKRGNIAPEKYDAAWNSFLSNILWSPRNLMSEIQSPKFLFYKTPGVRQAYIAGMARRLGLWITAAGLAKEAGKPFGVEVSLNPTNPDFGKIKYGQHRLDIPGGLQQFIVFAAQQMAGGKTSSTTGKFEKFGSNSNFPGTRAESWFQFGRNRLHPSLAYPIDLASGTVKDPVGVIDRTLQLGNPMFNGDMLKVLADDPKLLPIFAILGSIGFGVQHYEKGQKFNAPEILPNKYDIVLPSGK